MADHLGEIYYGVISGVTEWGLYVELSDNMCEGLVPMRDLADDYYDFDEANYCLVGRRHGARYRLGDEVKVKVARAALDKKQLDFVLVDDKGIPVQNDNMSKKISVAQALRGGKKKSSRGSQHRGRNRR